jgi:hypothetical protein
MADSASVELRGQASRDLVDMLDAISQHRRITRWQLIEEILGAWREDMERQTVDRGPRDRRSWRQAGPMTFSHFRRWVCAAQSAALPLLFHPAPTVIQSVPSASGAGQSEDD